MFYGLSLCATTLLNILSGVYVTLVSGDPSGAPQCSCDDGRSYPRASLAAADGACRLLLLVAAASVSGTVVSSSDACHLYGGHSVNWMLLYLALGGWLT